MKAECTEEIPSVYSAFFFVCLFPHEKILPKEVLYLCTTQFAFIQAQKKKNLL